MPRLQPPVCWWVAFAPPIPSHPIPSRPPAFLPQLLAEENGWKNDLILGNLLPQSAYQSLQEATPQIVHSYLRCLLL
jgi:hypothetical protein